LYVRIFWLCHSKQDLLSPPPLRNTRWLSRIFRHWRAACIASRAIDPAPRRSEDRRSISISNTVIMISPIRAFVCDFTSGLYDNILSCKFRSIIVAQWREKNGSPMDY
jgi:hypothetical protein